MRVWVFVVLTIQQVPRDEAHGPSCGWVWGIRGRWGIGASGVGQKMGGRGLELESCQYSDLIIIHH